MANPRDKHEMTMLDYYVAKGFSGDDLVAHVNGAMALYDAKNPSGPLPSPVVPAVPPAAPKRTKVKKTVGYSSFLFCLCFII
jgi:hypothetical protein